MSLFHLQHSSSAAWHIKQTWPPGANFTPSWVFLLNPFPPFLGANEKQMLHQKEEAREHGSHLVGMSA